MIVLCKLLLQLPYRFLFIIFLQDGSLSRREILENHAIFVGSQATNYGKAMGSCSRDEF